MKEAQSGKFVENPRYRIVNVRRRSELPYSPVQRRIDREIATVFEYNFTMHLPYDQDDKPSVFGYRAALRFVGAWDIKLKDWLREEGYDVRGYSLRRLNQTGEEFYRVFDNVSASFGIEAEEARRHTRPESEGGMGLEEKREFRKRTAPIYRRLRTMGYTKSELIR